MDLQPAHLQSELISLRPLAVTDFESLYAVASDPLIWEQHPNPDRYTREVFQNYFKGALESGGAFIILDERGQVIGSTRFYDYDPTLSEIKIGYTFFARSCWGKSYNRSAKLVMLVYAFGHVKRVIFHVGANNIRSQKAMEKLGASKMAEEEVAYYGETTRLNFVYQIESSFQP
jgi:RimJ/RimL family protein N-acetyltransferase